MFKKIWKKLASCNIYELFVKILFFSLGGWINEMWEKDHVPQPEKKKITVKDILDKKYGPDR